MTRERAHPIRVRPRESAAAVLVLLLGIVVAGCASTAGRHPEPSPAVVSPRPASAVLSVDPWEFAGKSGRVIRTPWYRLFTTETDPVLLDTLPEFLEEALDHYTTALAILPRPAMRLDTFLMATRPQWQALTLQVMGAANAGTYLRIERGGFSAGGRALLWSIGPRDTLAIAAHEGWHQYTQRTFRHWLPAWLEEGIAAYMEGFVADPRDPRRPIFAPWANVERFDQLRAAAARNALMPLDELVRVSPQDLIKTSTEQTLTYYAQVWALVHFLRDADAGRHRATLTVLLNDAALGRLEAALEPVYGSAAAHRIVLLRGGPAVFTTYFDADLPAAGAAYDEFVSRITAGSRDAILAGRSPLEP